MRAVGPLFVMLESMVGPEVPVTRRTVVVTAGFSIMLVK